MDNHSEKPQKPYETRDFTIGMYAKGLTFFVILLLSWIGGVVVFYRWLLPSESFKYNDVRDSGIPLTSRLQSNVTVQLDMNRLRKKELEEKTLYRWLNTNKTKVSLPIQRAKELVLKEGIKNTVATAPGVRNSPPGVKK